MNKTRRNAARKRRIARREKQKAFRAIVQLLFKRCAKELQQDTPSIRYKMPYMREQTLEGK